MQAQGRRTAPFQKPKSVLPFVYMSAAGHTVLLLGMLLFARMYQRPPAQVVQKPIRASLVRLGKPRNPKLLPRKRARAKAAPRAKSVAVTKDAEKHAQKPRPAPVDRKKTLFEAFRRVTAAGALEGDVRGSIDAEAQAAEGERYFGLLKTVVKRHYDVSNTIPEARRQTLQAEVALWIGHRGELMRVLLQKPSGNTLFDTAVVAAVKRAAPFSPPPPHLVKSLQKHGVAFLFNP